MNRITLGALLVLAGCARPAAEPARIEADARYAPVAEMLSRLIEREMADKALLGVSIALVDDQQTVWAQGFGWERPADSVPATAATIYRVGSVSKLLTDIAIMQEVERGRIDLDAPITQYLPDFRPSNPFGGEVTLRQLMSHRSGLVREPPRGHYFDDTGTTLAQTVASLNSTALVYAPESRPKYSNAAIATVGYVLERLHQQPFATYVKRAVLEPMGLRHSAFAPEPDIVRRLSAADMWTLHGTTFPAPTFELGMAPAGSMYATMPDLARFMSVLFAGGQTAEGYVLKPETLELMWTPQFAAPGTRTGFGIGFAIGELEGKRVVRHGGAIYGFATELAALPAEKLGVAVSIAKDGANAVADRIATAALQGMLAVRQNASVRPPVETRPTTMAVATRAAGEYGSGDAAFTIVRRDSTLSLRPHAGGHWARLRALAGDTLIVDDALAFGERLVLAGDGVVQRRGTTFTRTPPRGIPSDPPAKWQGLIGEYGWDHNVLYIYEQRGRLTALIEWFFEYPLSEIDSNTYAFPDAGLYHGERLVFARDGTGRATQVTAAGIVFTRRAIDGEGTVFRIKPVKPVEELRAAALRATPPAERGEFIPSDLVELTTLDSTIRLDVRYATDGNFLGVPVYTQARAFLQRPAAEAVVRAHRALARHGYGLLIHDGYRPWYVTKIFWDATPPENHVFVADPSQGSRHNRGGAVDLTLYDLKTGEPVMMPGGYDEMSSRSYPDYPGGTSRQRALRELLRAAMEAEGYRVYDAEWWHFDWKDWRKYRIGNETFENLRE